MMGGGKSENEDKDRPWGGIGIVPQVLCIQGSTRDLNALTVCQIT